MHGKLAADYLTVRLRNTDLHHTMDREKSKEQRAEIRLFQAGGEFLIHATS